MSLNNLAKTKLSSRSVTLPQFDEMPLGKFQADLGNSAARDMLLADPTISVALMVGSEPKRVLALLQPSVATVI